MDTSAMRQPVRAFTERRTGPGEAECGNLKRDQTWFLTEDSTRAVRHLNRSRADARKLLLELQEGFFQNGIRNGRDRNRETERDNLS